jgi:hypothetical protein
MTAADRFHAIVDAGLAVMLRTLIASPGMTFIRGIGGPSPLRGVVPAAHADGEAHG